MAAGGLRVAVRDVEAAVLRLRCYLPTDDPLWDDFYELLIDLGRVFGEIGDELDRQAGVCEGVGS